MLLWLIYVAGNNNIIRYSCKVPDIFVDFKQIWIISTDIHEKPPIFITVSKNKFHGNPSSGSRDMKKRISAFREVAKAPKGERLNE
jgi:hypothetical protein